MKTLTSSIVLKDVTAENIRDFSSQKKEPAWALELRLKAFAGYEAIDWPLPNNEKWKRSETTLLAFDKLSYGSEETTQAGPEWTHFSKALETFSDVVKESWTKAIEKAAGNKFLLLTLALVNDGWVLKTGRNESSKTYSLPMTMPAKGTARFVFNIVSVEEGSDIQLWEETPDATPNSQSGDFGFLGTYTALLLKPNSHAAHYALQHWDDHVIHYQFQDTYQEKDSRLQAVAVQMGGRVHRNESTINLKGQGAENKVLGVQFSDGSQNFENWITQNHIEKKTTSNIQYRGALKGSSRTFFSGMVSIVKTAQQSDAFQSSKSLLLSKEARADAIPNLEILADDVKCAHGAAVGQVDEDQKYYLQTRGVRPADAEKMIIEGFFEPVIAEVPSEPTREKLRAFVEEKLSRS